MIKKKISYCMMAVLLLLTAVAGCSSKKDPNSSRMSYDEASIKLDNLLQKMDGQVEERSLKKNLGSGKDTSTALIDELPDVSDYPVRVEGDGQVNIEVASSPEKAGTEKNVALIEVAKNFNNEKITLSNGKTVSVSITDINSGEAVDYYKTGKYSWDVYAPSNQYWGKILEAEGVSVDLKTERIAGNTTGFAFEKNEYDKFIEKYQEVTVESVAQAVIDGELSFGYTNPYASSTGLNFLLSLLHSMDASNPLSDTAKETFVSFSENINHLSYTTIQLKTKAINGSIKACVYEYQGFVNTQELKDYVYVPFGLRHDNPVYTVGDLGADKEEAVDLFVEYCLNEKSQGVFSEYGFNQKEVEDYQSEELNYSGSSILAAQKLWKEEKNTQEVAVVIVEDMSGSMDGEPVNQMKKTLLELMDYIDEEHHVGLVSYDDDVYIDLPLGKFDDMQRAYYRGAIDYMTPGGGTATNNALLIAAEMLRDYKEDNEDVKLMIVLMSDGEQNTGYDLNKVEAALAGLKIPIHTVGYNTEQASLEQLAQLNEASNISATSDNVLYKLKAFFNAEF